MIILYFSQILLLSKTEAVVVAVLGAGGIVTTFVPSALCDAVSGSTICTLDVRCMCTCLPPISS